MFDAIYAYFQSPRWQTPVQSFIESNCIYFEADRNNDNAENRRIHKVFTKMIDKLMQTLLSEIGINQKQFIDACHKAKTNKNHWKIVKQILLVEDFHEFEKIMIKRNNELEKKAYSLMLQQEEERLKRFFKNQGTAQESESDQEEEMDESMLLAIRLSEEQARKEQMMAQMNSTAGFNMALKMSAAGTFGQGFGGSTKHGRQDEDEDDDEEEAIR